MKLIGCGAKDMTQILKRLGYRQVRTEDEILFQRRKPIAKGAGFNPKQTKFKTNPNSPFAELAKLKDSI